MAPIKISDFASFGELMNPSANHKNQCIWCRTQQGVRCNNTVNKIDIDKAFELGAALQRSSPSEISLQQLKEFARLKCCKRWHRSTLHDSEFEEPLARRWLHELSETATVPSAALPTPSSTSSNIVHEPSIPDQPVYRIIETRLRSQQSSRAGTAIIEQTASTNSTIPTFRPRVVKKHESVLDKIHEPLGSGPAIGTIYLFTQILCLAFIKIGYSKYKAEHRLQQWKRSCGYEPILCAAFDNVPNAKKVEQLIHFQLAHVWRMQSPCARCGGTQHQEWFKIGQEEATAIARQWVEWMRRAVPYGADKRLKGVWVDELRYFEVRGINITAELLLNIHTRLLPPPPVVIEVVEEEQTETQIDLDHDTTLLTNTTIQSPLFTDGFTTEPQPNISQAQILTTTPPQIQLQLLATCLSTMLTIVQTLAQVSPEVLNVLVQQPGNMASGPASQNSMVSSTRQASLISAGSQ